MGKDQLFKEIEKYRLENEKLQKFQNVEQIKEENQTLKKQLEQLTKKYNHKKDIVSQL